MARCRYRGMMFGAAGCLLLAACSSTPLPEARHPWWEAQGALPVKTVATPPIPAPPEVDKKIVTAYAHYLQALVYDMDEQPDKALEEFTQAVLNDPTNEDLVLELTRRHIQKRQLDKALEILVRATAVPGASGEIYARLGVVYSQLGKNDLAAEASQTAIKRSPKSLAGYRVLYLVNLQKGQPTAAEKVLDQAAKVEDTSPEFCAELSELYANLLRQAPSLRASISVNALAMLNRATKSHPTNPQLRLKLGNGYYAMGDTTNAAKVYKQLLESETELPILRNEVRLKMAEIYLHDQDSTNATAQLKAIVADDPSNSQVYYLLGRLAYDDKKLPEAAEYFHRTLILSDDNRDAYYKLAEVQIDLQRPNEAISTLETARAKFGNGFINGYLMALAYVREKNFTNAVNEFTSAEVIAKTTEPKMLTAGFYFEAGAACERKGDFGQAEEYFDKSLAMSPNFPEALNYLGYMLADRNVKLEKARGLIEKAVKIEPKSAAYLDSLGWVMYRLKRPQEALEHIQAAIKLSEEADATLYDHLGDVYAELKQKDKAADAWRKSLAVEPNEEIKKKLEQSTGKAPAQSAH